ncbi:hypothetical protein JQ617_15595 [Bradyrhizobium sp. KB893862 SZCCT0404]|uniref:hypothetical protein n=1 Tax=Bradyrhizobium sp. KB893862 SZCCT0404 TaxID=2807672 RepID=UPI001BAC27C9|nr:hypothetical protein [Bradyrhizobium sp. KB893862 SZCCT0404]MBR1175386.1 hypothetical protein [Bradyrhizobium sp. KB893862 SZCCT0404]
MPIIKVFDQTAGASNQGYAAAAAMAVTLAKATEPEPANVGPRKRVKAERTRPRNPNRLTIDQHVFPLKSIKRFVGQSGRVSVRLLTRDKVIQARPNGAVFCASRAWDHRAETGYMKRIEDDFQRVVDPIVEGRSSVVLEEDKHSIDRMYALWYMRARYRELEAQEIQLNGITGSHLTLEQEENLERNGYIFTRERGTMPARQLNGVVLQMRMDWYAHHLSTHVQRWGVIVAQSGEFVVPDVPWHQIMPLTPRLALVHSSLDGMITEQNLAQINAAMTALSRDYFFARDFANCPLL